MAVFEPGQWSEGVGAGRRNFLRAASAVGALGMAGVGGRQVLAAPPVRNLKLAWNTNVFFFKQKTAYELDG
mgnify:CR=1 FL=1